MPVFFSAPSSLAYVSGTSGVDEEALWQSSYASLRSPVLLSPHVLFPHRRRLRINVSTFRQRENRVV